jgi:hypothetical protein
MRPYLINSSGERAEIVTVDNALRYVCALQI